MIKLRNLILYLSSFILLFLLFQIISYAMSIDTRLNVVSIVKTENNTVSTFLADYALVADESNKKASDNIENTLRLLDLPVSVYSNLSDFRGENCLIIASSLVNDSDVEAIKNHLNEGRSVIFAVAPNENSLENSELMNLLGIVNADIDYRITGFDIYSPILLGGMFRVTDISFDCIRVKLSGRCKVFANGHNPDRNITAPVIDKNDENPIVWRTYYNEGIIYIVNAPFFEDIGGMGILTGLIADMQPEFIYPIIGTKTVLFPNFPNMDDHARQIENRSAAAFMRDIIWPDLVSMSRESMLTYTLFTNVEFNNNPEALQTIKFFADENSKHTRGEIGYMVNTDDLAILTKNIDDRGSGYFGEVFTSLWMSYDFPLPELNSHPEIVSVIEPKWTGQSLNWFSDYAMALPVVSSGIFDEYQTFKMASVASALGFISHSVELSESVMGDLPEQSWNKVSINLSKYFSWIFRDKSWLKPQTASQTAETVKDYMNTHISIEKADNKIRVLLEGHGGEREFSLLLRTEKKVISYSDCEVVMLEDSAYLITTNKQELSLELQ